MYFNKNVTNGFSKIKRMKKHIPLLLLLYIIAFCSCKSMYNPRSKSTTQPNAVAGQIGQAPGIGSVAAAGGSAVAKAPASTASNSQVTKAPAGIALNNNKQLLAARDTPVEQAYSTAKFQPAAATRDTSITDPEYTLRFVKKADVIKFFAPYFEKNIAWPGNVKHPAYVNLMAKAKKQSATVKAEYIKRFKDHPDFDIIGKKLGGITAINQCEFDPIPLYYLTFNIVQYHQEPNISQYYNLDTSEITYTVSQKNTIIGLVTFNKGTIGKVQLMQNRDSLNINHIKLSGKQPIALLNTIYPPQDVHTTRITDYGYVEQGHIVLSLCRKGTFVKQGGGADNYADKDDGKTIFIDECKAETIEEYGLNNPSYFFDRIRGAYMYMLRKEHKQPLIPGGN